MNSNSKSGGALIILPPLFDKNRQTKNAPIKQFLLSHDRRIIIVSVFVFIINYVVVFPMSCPACLQFYPNEMISWSSLKISDGAWKQFQRIKKSLLPKTRKEGTLLSASQDSPALTSFFLLRDYIFKFLFFIYSLIRQPRRKYRRRFQDLPQRFQRARISSRRKSDGLLCALTELKTRRPRHRFRRLI